MCVGALSGNTAKDRVQPMCCFCLQIKFQRKIKFFSAGRDHLKYSLETDKFLLAHWETLSPVSTAYLAQSMAEYDRKYTLPSSSPTALYKTGQNFILPL